MDSSNVPPPGSRPIKEPKRRLNKGSTQGSFSPQAFGATSQPSFGGAPSSPSGSMQPFGQQPQQSQQMSFGFNSPSMANNPLQSPSFQQQQQPSMNAFGNGQAPPAPPSFTFGASSPSSGQQTPPTSTGFSFGNQTQSTAFGNSGLQRQPTSLGGFGTTPSAFSFGNTSAPQQQQQPAMNSNPFGSNQLATTDSSMDASDDQVKPSTGFSFGSTAATPVSSATLTAPATTGFGRQSSSSSIFGEQPKPTATSGFPFGSSTPQTTGGFGQQPTDTQQKFGFGDQSKTATPASTLSFGTPSVATTAPSSQASQAQKDSGQPSSSPFAFGGSTFGTGAGLSTNVGFGSTLAKEGEKKSEDQPSTSMFNFGSTNATKNTLEQPKQSSLFGSTTTETSKKRKGPDSETSEPSKFKPFQVTQANSDTSGNKALVPFGKTNSQDDNIIKDDKITEDKGDKAQNGGDNSDEKDDQDAPNKKRSPASNEQSTTLKGSSSFSFGTTPQASTTESSGEKAKTIPAGLSFGASKPSGDSSADKPAFSFGTPAPKPSDEGSAPKPAFSFGTPAPKPSEDGSASKPAFSFGIPASKSSDDSSAPKPAFSFGTPAPKTSDDSSADKPAFSFGTPTSKPSDDGSASKLTFSFGTPATKTSEDGSAPKPVFSFGTPAPKPSDDGSVPKPAFSFGTPAPKPSGDSSAPKPAFSFGTPAPKPAFSFNAPAAKTSDDSSADKPAFSFGTPTSKPSDDGSASKPAFSFGTPATKSSEDGSAPKPAFSFGTPASKTSEDGSAPKPAFSFGTPAPKTSDEGSVPKPAFSFGTPAPTTSSDDKSTQKAVASSTPTFSFGKSTPDTSQSKPSAASSEFSLTKPTSPFTFGQPDATQKKDDGGDVNKEKDQVSAAKPPLFGSTTNTATKQDKPSLFSFGAPSSNNTTSEDSALKRKGDDLQSLQPNKMTTTQFTPKTTFGNVEKDKSSPAINLFTQPAPSGDDSSETSTFKLPDQSKARTATTLASTSTKEADKPATSQPSIPKSQTTTPSTLSFSTKATTTTPVVKPEDTFKPLVSKDNVPITVSSTSTPTKSILKSSSTSKDTFGVATPSTSVQTALQSSITSVDQIKESTRYAQLPTDAQSVLLEAEQFINNQQLFSRNIQTRIDAFGGEDILHVNTQVSKLLDNVGALKEQLQAQSQMITRLGTDIKQQMDATEINKAITDRGHTRRIPGSGDHQKYFAELYEKLRNQLVEFESAIRQIEERLQQETSSGKAPQDIGMLLSSQNQLFLSLSGKASELHQQVQNLLPQGNNKNHIATTSTTRTYVFP